MKKGKKEDAGNYRLVNLTSVLGKAMEQTLLEAISKHMKDVKVMGSSEHLFIKGKSWLTKLIAFYNEFTAAMDKGRPVNVAYLDYFRNTYETVPHSLLITKFMRCGMDKWTMKWVENCLDCRAQNCDQ